MPSRYDTFLANPLDILFKNNTLYSTSTLGGTDDAGMPDYVYAQNKQAQQYTEAALAVNWPSFPLSNPFAQAANYVDAIYLIIQHFMRAMSPATIGLEKRTNQKDQDTHLAVGSATITDQGYEAFPDHQLNDILQQPNPADNFTDFLCQCILNWNLHGRVLIWGVPNAAGAPERLYCLPVPLMVPAYQVGSPAYPLGAWRLQPYYPNSSMIGVMPTGLAGAAGTVIDNRQIYDMKNPHPVYRWAPYSPLVGGQSAVDIKNNIDLSFWSIMSQGPKPTGIIDAPGADEAAIRGIQNTIDNAHGGARKHGKMMVIGGGNPERPALKLHPFHNMKSDDSLHSAGWEIFMSFLCALFGLDMTVVGLRKTGGYAERWAAKNDAREGYLQFLVKLASLLTQGPCAQWGLRKKGVRVIVTLPPLVGYEPAEMSRDGAADGSMTLDEVRHLRGLRSVPKYGKYPVVIALEMMQRDLGIDDHTEQMELIERQAELAPTPTDSTSSSSSRKKKPIGKKGTAGSKAGYSTDKRDRKSDNQQMVDNRPQNLRKKTPKKAKGALGGKGSSPKHSKGSVTQKAITEDDLLSDDVYDIIARTVPSTNGKH